VPAPAAARRFAAFVEANASARSPLAQLPFPADASVEAYEPSARFMYLATFHGRPLVNGYSSYFPQTYERLLSRLQLRVPEIDTLALDRGGVRTLLIDRSVHPTVRVGQEWRKVWSDRELALDGYLRATDATSSVQSARR
jgi:hypothetical protein